MKKGLSHHNISTSTEKFELLGHHIKAICEMEVDQVIALQLPDGTLAKIIRMKNWFLLNSKTSGNVYGVIFDYIKLYLDECKEE